MHKVAAFVISWMLGLVANGQCTHNIGANFTVIDRDTVLTTFSGNHWVCAGVTVVFEGFYAFVHAEEGTDVTVNGGLGQIFMKGNSTLNINGNGNGIAYVPSTVVNINGDFDQDFECATMVFNTTNAPQPGCSGTTGTPEPRVEGTVLAYPNPAYGWLMLDLGGEKLVEARLLDMTGKEVGRSARLQFDLDGVRTGKYVLEVTTTSGLHRQLVTVQ